ncbi:MAG: tetratricopeptide repeat protein [Candidatus Omnitrophica bacterium]|nr:tetratricopeptide repeat protein [Candidatus Omnitrophota bacterium]
MRTLILFLALLTLPLSGFSGCAMLEPVDEAAPPPRFKTPTEHYNKALDYYQKGRYTQAKELFHEYVAQYPDSAILRIALYYLAHCYQIQGDEKEALVIYNRIIAAYGSDDFWSEQAFKRIKQIKGEE